MLIEKVIERLIDRPIERPIERLIEKSIERTGHLVNGHHAVVHTQAMRIGLLMISGDLWSLLPSIGDLLLHSNSSAYCGQNADELDDPIRCSPFRKLQNRRCFTMLMCWVGGSPAGGLRSQRAAGASCGRFVGKAVDRMADRKQTHTNRNLHPKTI